MKFKYAYREIENNAIISILLILQLAFVFFSIYNVLQVNMKISEQTTNIGSFFKSSKAYRISFLDSPEVYLKNSKNEESLKYITNYLSSNKNFNFIHLDNSAEYPLTFKGYNDFAEHSHNVQDGDKVFFPALHITINKNYLKTYPLKISEGRGFEDSDFERSLSNDVIPVVVGYDYSNHFKLGDEIEIYRGKDAKLKIKIVGILEKDQYSIGDVTSVSNKYINLNNRIISTTASYSDNREEVFGLLLPGNYIFFDENTSQSQVDDAFEQIKSVFREKVKTEVNCENLNENIKYESASYKGQLKISIITAVVIIVCVSITLIISVLDSINKRREEFAIHIFSGGTLKDICIYIYLQITVIFIIGFVLSIPFIMLINNTNDLNFNCLVSLFSISILSAITIAIIPIMKIMKLSVSDLIKGDE